MRWRGGEKEGAYAWECCKEGKENSAVSIGMTQFDSGHRGNIRPGPLLNRPVDPISFNRFKAIGVKNDKQSVAFPFNPVRSQHLQLPQSIDPVNEILLFTSKVDCVTKMYMHLLQTICRRRVSHAIRAGQSLPLRTVNKQKRLLLCSRLRRTKKGKKGKNRPLPYEHFSALLRCSAHYFLQQRRSGRRGDVCLHRPVEKLIGTRRSGRNNSGVCARAGTSRLL